MKVPTYKKQASFTPETGGRMLSVQADANVFSAPGRAAAQGGQQLFNAGLQWYGHELKLKRASELSSNDQLYQVNSAKIKNDLLYGDPENNIAPWDPATVQDEFKNRTKILRDSLGLNIQDKVVKTRFLSAAQTRDVTNSIEVMKISRAALIDKRLGELITEENMLLEELAKHQPKTIAYEEAYTKYFGQEGYSGTTETIVDPILGGKHVRVLTKGQPQILGLWEKAAEMGLISQEEVAKKYIKAGETVALTTLKGHIAAAGTEKDLKIVLNNLQDPTKRAELYPNLSEADVNYQTTKLQKAIELKLLEEERDDRNARQEADRNEKINWRKNATKYTTLIDKHQSDPENNSPVTHSELLMAYENNDIKESTYNALIARISNSDALFTNTAKFADTINMIKDAQNEDDLEAAYDYINGGLGVNGWLKQSDYENLVSMIDRKRENTPEYQMYEFQGDLLETTLKQTFNVNDGTESQNEENQEIINQATIMYERLANPGNPNSISGEEAYKKVINTYTYGRTTVPPVIIPQQSITKRPKFWSFTDVRAAIDELGNNPNNYSNDKIVEEVNKARVILRYLNSLHDAGKYENGPDGKDDRYENIEEPVAEIPDKNMMQELMEYLKSIDIPPIGKKEPEL